MANSATRMLLPRNGNSFPLHLLRATTPKAAGALLSVPCLRPNLETQQPSFLAHLPINDHLFFINDRPRDALLGWRAASPGKKEAEEEETDGKRTNDLDDDHTIGDDSECDDEFDDDDDDEDVDDDYYSE